MKAILKIEDVGRAQVPPLHSTHLECIMNRRREALSGSP